MNMSTGEVVLSQSVEAGDVCLQLPILYCGCYKLSYIRRDIVMKGIGTFSNDLSQNGHQTVYKII